MLYCHYNGRSSPGTGGAGGHRGQGGFGFCVGWFTGMCVLYGTVCLGVLTARGLVLSRIALCLTNAVSFRPLLTICWQVTLRSCASRHPRRKPTRSSFPRHVARAIGCLGSGLCSARHSAPISLYASSSSVGMLGRADGAQQCKLQCNDRLSK